MITNGKKNRMRGWVVSPDHPAGFQIGLFFAVHILVVSGVCEFLYGCLRAVTAACGVGTDRKKTTL